MDGASINTLDRGAGTPQQGGNGALARYAIALALTIVIFSLDAFTSIGGAIAVLYVVVLVLIVGDNGARRRRIYLWSAACAALTVASFVITRNRQIDPNIVLRLLVSLAANVVTTVLLVRARAADETLRASEARHRTILNSLAIAIWEHDFTPVEAAIARLRESGVTDLRRYVAEHPEFVIAARKMVRITDVNGPAVEMMGFANKEAFFSHLSDFLPETDESFADCIVAIDERRALFHAETIVRSPCGEMLDLIVAFGLGGSGPLDRIPGSILDITGRKRLEIQVERTRAELAQVQRASALGAISASIAHEVNQPLSAIHSYSDAARRWLSRATPDLPEAIRALESLGRAVDHARDVVQRVRALVGTAKTTAAEVDLTPLIADVAALLRREAEDHNARIIVDPGTASEQAAILVIGDRILLKQMLVNLVTNGLQALGDSPPDRRLVILSTGATGSTAYIRVADTGPGWDEAAQDRAFQTFFTTKQDGMGLGLSICRATMESHGGTLTLLNAVGGGAIVEATLPLHITGPALTAECAGNDAGEAATVERLLE